MLFKELILEARKRLHDIRRADMVLITDSTEDGIRWSSAQLQQVVKGALQEMLRTFRSRKRLGKFINNAVQNQIIDIKILASTGLVTDLPAGYYKIHRLQLQQKDLIYTEVSVDKFAAKDWELAKQSATVVDDLCAIDERWFLPYWDATTKTIKIKTLPLPTVDVNGKAYVTQQPTELFTIASTVELPFVDVDDIILDFIEKNASQIEDNFSQVKLLVETIQLKLKELVDEL